MARGLKITPPSKGRIQQTLKKQVANEIARIRVRDRNPAQHAWLVRHMERQGGRCAYCGIPMLMSPRRRETDRRATLDHVVPLSRHGADSESNTVAACEACNTAKADMILQLFLASPFFIARKAHAATIPVRKPTKLVVTVLKRPRPKPPTSEPL